MKGITMVTTTRQFPTGAVRSTDADSERYDLISPIGHRRLAEACAEGAAKYGDYNWEQGMPILDLLNHAIRHINLYLGSDRSEDHLAHAAWGLFAAMHSEELWPELNAETLRRPGCRPPAGAEKPRTVLDDGVPVIFDGDTTKPVIPVFDTAGVGSENVQSCESLYFDTDRTSAGTVE